MKSLKLTLGVLLLWGVFPVAFGQSFLNKAKVSGNIQMNAQYYIEDSLIGAEKVNNRIRTNTFANINYSNGGFAAGLRYEYYAHPLIDFEKIGYVGEGIPYYYFSYTTKRLEVVAGSFYEQFGSGLVYRSYEDRNLGYDNATRGVKIKAQPYKGITITGVLGKQRNLFEHSGQLRGLDADLSLNELFEKIGDNGFRLGMGASFMSKFEADNDPVYRLPENVAAFAGRANLGYRQFSLNGEYAYKINDPIALNDMIYKPGNALLLTASYAKKGLGIFLTGLRTDNFDFRSNRSALSNNYMINYIPTLTKEHTYMLATQYAYSSQPLGQIGFQGEVRYKIPKKTLLGGKYGTDITVNYSRMHGIQKDTLDDVFDNGGEMGGTLGYSSPFFGAGELYYEDFNMEISHKFNKKWRTILTYMHQVYNMEVIEGHPGEPNVVSDVVIGDIYYSITPKHALHMEVQHLATKQDKGNWLYGMIEYTITPHWFFSLMDAWNYGNSEDNLKIHYYNIGTSYVHDATKVTLGFGKVEEGILCVGGVCRPVPASYGLNLQVVTTF
ncbi:MAG: hypothetical protein J5792_02815 [Bacteroidales bacterium]|nr:hypothetical protein [Bacteroidales bacterium]